MSSLTFVKTLRFGLLSKLIYVGAFKNLEAASTLIVVGQMSSYSSVEELDASSETCVMFTQMLFDKLLSFGLKTLF